MSALRPERYIESADPEMQSLAAKLKRPEARDTAQAIYDWVRQHLHYMGYLADDRGAVYALKHLQGDCTEYAYLAVALARASGIPARMADGYVTDKMPLWEQLIITTGRRFTSMERGDCSMLRKNTGCPPLKIMWCFAFTGMKKSILLVWPTVTVRATNLKSGFDQYYSCELRDKSCLCLHRPIYAEEIGATKSRNAS